MQFFFIPGAFGQPAIFSSLINGFNTPQSSVEKTHCLSLDGSAESITQIAQTLIKEFNLMHTKEDRIVIVGYSFGGFVAQEITKQLHQAGRNTVFGIMIDTPAKINIEKEAIIKEIDQHATQLAQSMKSPQQSQNNDASPRNRSIKLGDAIEQYEQFIDNNQNMEAFIGNLIQHIEEKKYYCPRLMKDKFYDQEFRKDTLLFLKNIKALIHYQDTSDIINKNVNQYLYLIQSSESQLNSLDSTWEGLAKTYTVPDSNHNNIISQEKSEKLKEIILEILTLINSRKSENQHESSPLPYPSVRKTFSYRLLTSSLNQTPSETSSESSIELSTTTFTHNLT